MLVKINMRKSLLLLLFVLQTIVVWAQKLTVESFKLVENDISAQTQPCKDLNDRNCALVKVQFESSATMLSSSRDVSSRRWEKVRRMVFHNK